MLINRRQLRRQPLHLPPIHPDFMSPSITSTIDATINLSSNQGKNYSPKWYADAFKLFEQDFSSDKLETEFDQMIEDALAHRNIQQSDISEEEFVRQISSEVKIKLFHQYIRKRRRQSVKNQQRAKSRERSLNSIRSRTRMEVHTISGEKLQSAEKLHNKSSQRIFAIEGMFKNQEQSKSSINRKYVNFRAYHQHINPIHFIHT